MYTTNTILMSVPNDLGVYFYYLLLTSYGQDLPRRLQTAWGLHNITVHMLPDVDWNQYADQYTNQQVAYI